MVKEVANSLWKHFVRGAIGLEHALKAYRALRMLIGSVVVVESQEKYMDKAFEIALNHGVMVYDALYIAQAISKGGLITADEGQARVAERLGISVHLV